MGTKISELPTAGALAGNEILPVVQAGETRKTTVSAIAASHTHTGTYEPALGNPSVTGQVLSSTTAGVRSWVSAGSPGLVLLSTATASNSTSVDFTGIDSTYDEYEIHVQDALLAQLCIRVSTNNGSTWLTSGYYGMWHRLSDNSAAVSSAQIVNADRLNTADVGYNIYPYNGVIKLYFPHTGSYRILSWEFLHSRFYRIFGAGNCGSSPINAVRLLAGSGNVLSGYFKLYGLRKTV